MRFSLLVLVFVGGGIGSVARYAMATSLQRAFAGPFPVGTFFVNLVGCFGIGLVGALGLERAASSVVHRARLVELSEDLPIVVEIVDTEEKIRTYLERIEPILDEAGCGVLMTMERV